MKYTELIIKSKYEYAEITQAVLIEAGFTAMQIDDPRDAIDIAEHRELYKYDYINEEISQTAAEAETLAEGDVTVTLYFTDDEEGQSRVADAEALVQALRTDKEENINYKIATTGDDSEWLYKWHEHFKPTRVGERIVVKPGWEDYEAADGDLVIEMDPGMAFGSGLHETTSMCVKALEKALGASHKEAPTPDNLEMLKCSEEASSEHECPTAEVSADLRRIKVLDVGTGTGILAMAAVLLGADEALGIDIDDEAVRVAGENIKKNGLDQKISIRKGDLMAGVDYIPDIIVANLMADLVIMLSPAAAAQLRPGGIYITSGILDVKESVVKKAIEDAGFDIIEMLADGEWRAIAALRR